MEFESLKLSAEVKRAIKEMGFTEMTPVQETAIPLMVKKKDIIVQAPTGTGKTCAYAIPAIEDIDANSDSVQMLVLCPTRELAIQSVDEIRKVFAYKEGISALAIYGGQQIERQILALKKHPQIIVGTPGRVIDHLKRKTLRFNNIKLLVLDEADEMLNMGFRDDIDFILKGLPNDHQTVLFSATMPNAIKEISKLYQKEDVVSVTTLRDKENLGLIKQYYIQLKEKQKAAALITLLDTLDYKLVLVFCRTKKRVDELTGMLQGYSYEVEALHGDLRQSQRDTVMRKFRSGEINVLIATDVAARGLDIENVDLVINFDLTDVDEYYLHRIGRTGRANKTGIAYTFITKSQHSMLKVYERLTNGKITQITLPENKDNENRRLDSFLKKVQTVWESEDLLEIENYLAIKIKELNETGNSLSALRLAAALLQKATARKEIIQTEEEENKKERRSKTKEGHQRFFINLGSLDNLRGSDLIKIICQKCDIERSDFADVYMRNTYSFFELPKEKTDMILQKLNGELHNNRIIAVELSDKKAQNNKGDAPKKAWPFSKVQDKSADNEIRKMRNKRNYDSGRAEKKDLYRDRAPFERKEGRNDYRGPEQKNSSFSNDKNEFNARRKSSKSRDDFSRKPTEKKTKNQPPFTMNRSRRKD